MPFERCLIRGRLVRAALFILFGANASVAQGDLDSLALDFVDCVRVAAAFEDRLRHIKAHQCIENARRARGNDPADLWSVEEYTRKLVQEEFAALKPPGPGQSHAYAMAYQHVLDVMKVPACVGRYSGMTILCGVHKNTEDLLAIYAAALLMSD